MPGVPYYADSTGTKQPFPIPVHNHDLTYAARRAAPDADWVPVVWQNNYKRYSVSWPDGAYRRLENGMVIMRGLTGSDSSFPTGESNAMFILPAGYRPGENLHLSALIGHSTNSHGIANVKVLVNGAVIFDTANPPGTVNWLALETVPTFMAEQ